MIEDLKADSARWDNERRAQTSRNTSGGSSAARERTAHAARHASNSPIVHYHQSETHQSRQHYGPSSEAPYQPDPYSHDSGYDAKRYPGSGAAGYTGTSGHVQPPQAQQQQQQQQAPYSGTGTYGAYQHGQPAHAQNTRFANPGGSMMPPPSGSYQEPYVATGANRPYSASNDSYSARSSAAPPSQPSYATSSPQQSGYPASSYSYGQVPSSGAPSYPITGHPQDPFMGRGASYRI